MRDNSSDKELELARQYVGYTLIDKEWICYDILAIRELENGEWEVDFYSVDIDVDGGSLVLSQDDFIELANNAVNIHKSSVDDDYLPAPKGAYDPGDDLPF